MTGVHSVDGPTLRECVPVVRGLEEPIIIQQQTTGKAQGVYMMNKALFV